MICDICVEESKKHIRCLSCDLDVCLSCFERYQMESVDDEIQCMKCNKHFQDDYLFENLTVSKLSQLKRRKKDLLFEKEKVHFPETQVFVKYDKAVQNEITPVMNANVKEMVRLHKQCLNYEANLDTLSCDEGRDYLESRKKVRHIARVVAFLKKIINCWNMDYVIYKPRYRTHFFDPKYTDIQSTEFLRTHIPHEIYNNPNVLNRSLRYLQQTAVINNEQYEHVMSCSQNDCKGFVMKNDWTCGICDTVYCKKCLKPSNENHVCVDEDVQTASVILKTSKPCPKCAARIHKISGCDQMFCTNCKTAFSWTTLKIETGIVHNPHFFEWQNRMGTDIHQVEDPCGRPAVFRIVNHCERLYDFDFYNCDGKTENVEFLSYLITVNRLTAHISAIEMLRRFNTEPLSQFFNIDLRIKYLNGRMSESHMKTVLHKRFKSIRVNIRRVQVLQLFVTVSIDILIRFLSTEDSSNETRNRFKEEFESLFDYVEECFVSLSKIYNMAMPVVRVYKTNRDVPRYMYDFNQDKFTGYLLMKKYN